MATATAALTSFSPDASLSRYLHEIRGFPMLSAEEEFMLAKRWQEHGDSSAAHRLVTSHLRLAAKLAMGYRGYGLPVSDLIAEGNLGVMQAVKRFDPDRGFRFSTYAMWWIRAAVQEYILRSWSLVKIGTTAAQKKLFFNLRRIKAQLSAIHQGELPPATVATIAQRLHVTEREVMDMNRRMAGADSSLNAPVGIDGESERQDLLVDDAPNQEERLGENEELGDRRASLARAMKRLTERERRILTQRRLQDDEPVTLADLAAEYGISRERVRQIEMHAFGKLQRAMRAPDGTMRRSLVPDAGAPRSLSTVHALHERGDLDRREF
jgi:RNA polymerase sigma-32 factor